MNKPSSTPKVCKKETKKVAGMETIKRQMDSLTEMVNDLQVDYTRLWLAEAFIDLYSASNGVWKGIKQLETWFATKNNFDKV